MSRTPNQPAVLSESLHRRLNSYALAASAAGVGILALAQPTEARIVYTKTHHVITPGRYALDLNHDGIIDFSIAWAPGNVTSGSFNPQLDIYPAKNRSRNQVWGGILYSDDGHTMGPIAASALNAGVSVGQNSSKFQPNHTVMWGGAREGCGTSSNACTFGQWKINVKNKYLGLKFYINGSAHYGWARLSTPYAKHDFLKPTLTGYAYETVHDKPIITGKTKGPDVIALHEGSLGHLSRGTAH